MNVYVYPLTQGSNHIRSLLVALSLYVAICDICDVKKVRQCGSSERSVNDRVSTTPFMSRTIFSQSRNTWLGHNKLYHV